MSTLGSINVKIGADTAGLVAGTNRARDAMGRFIPLAQQAGGAAGGFGQRATDAAGAVREFGDAGQSSTRSIEGLVKQLGGAAAQVVAVKTATDAAWGALKNIVQTTADFDQKMSKVAAVSGAAGDQLGILRKAAIDLGSATVFSATEVADGMAVLAAAGISDTNAILAAMPGLLDTAAAAGADFTTATEIASGAMNAFKLQAGDMGHVGDVLASAAQMSQVSMTDLGYSLKYVGPVAQASGISLEGTAAALTVLGDSAIKGEQAGTTLRAILASLTAPSNEAAMKMKELGINAFDSTGHMLKLSEISGMFQERLKGMTEQQRNAAIATIFGREAMSGAIAIIGKGEEKFAELEGKFHNVDNAAHEMAETMTDNLNGAVEQFNGQLEALAITLGTPITAGLKDATKGATGFLEQINIIAGNGFELLGAAADKYAPKLANVFPSPLRDATAFLSVIGGIMQAMNATSVQGFGSGLAATLQGLGGLVQGMDPTLRNLFFGKSDFVPIAAEKHAGGGLLGGIGTGTSDSNLFWGSRGEMVINAEQTRRFYPLLNAINAKRFATGGVIGGDLYGPNQTQLPSDIYRQSLTAQLTEQASQKLAAMTLQSMRHVVEVEVMLDQSSHIYQTAAMSWVGSVSDSGSVMVRALGDTAHAFKASTEALKPIELPEGKGKGNFADMAADSAERLGKALQAFTDDDLYDFANGVNQAKDTVEKGFEWLDKPDAADAWAYATETVKDAGKGVQEFAASATQASTSVAQASEVVSTVTPAMQRYGERMADALQNTEFKIEAAGKSMAEKIRGVAGSFTANVEGMFPSLKNAQKLFDGMNKSAWTLQNGNTFFDFGALKAMQEGNLRLLAVMEKGGEALNSEWLDSLLGTSAAWGDSLAGQSAAIGQATAAQDVATESTRAMSDSLIQATDSVSGSLVAAGEGMLASASATAAAGQWMANTFLANGMVVNRAAASMSAGLASASSGVLAAASAAVSAIGSQLAQIGAGSGLSELARQMQNAGLTGAVEATLPGGSPSGLESSGGSMGSSRGNSRNGGGWVNGGYGQLPPIVLVLDGKEVHTSVQGYGNYYGAGNVSGGFS